MQFELTRTAVLDFVVTNPTTGAATAADSTPTVAVFENDSDTPILTPVPVARSGYTGNYRVNIECTAGNGFELGKSYNVVVTATVNNIVARGVINTFTLRPITNQVIVQPDGGNSATQFESDLTDATDDHWKDAYCLFISGTLAGQVKKITAYDGTTKILSFTSGFTGTPSNGDIAVVING